MNIVTPKHKKVILYYDEEREISDMICDFANKAQVKECGVHSVPCTTIKKRLFAYIEEKATEIYNESVNKHNPHDA
jgi:hypothetical protein